MLKGKGVTAVVVMWVMVFLSFILVPLRFYTRLYVVKAVGLDDHVYNLAWIFLLLYTIFVTIAGVHGFGQPMAALAMDEAVKAVYNEMIGQTFAVLGMAIAKLSLGIFLLRIVVKQWHRISIWAAMISLSIVSVMTAIIFWVQKLPSKSIYDPRIEGRLIVGVTPFSVLLGVWCAVVDFYFALLPWIFIWNLNMKRKEKISITASLSLGFIACACGIIRTIELGGLASANYTEATVNLIIWSGVELAVTLICTGIPTIRPLYRAIFHGSHPSHPESSSNKLSSNKLSQTPYRMRNMAKGNTLFSVVEGENDIVIGNNSDEEILRGQYRSLDDGIHVQEEVQVERTWRNV